MAMNITNAMTMKITNITIMIITVLIMRRHVVITMEMTAIAMITMAIVIARAFITISWRTPARRSIAIAIAIAIAMAMAMAMSIITMNIRNIAIRAEIMIIRIATVLILSNSFLTFLLAIYLLMTQKVTLQKQD
jgi:hypothetical protein